MLPIQIFPENGGIVALGPTTLGNHIVLQLGRDFAKGNVTLNRSEAAALIQALSQVLTGMNGYPATIAISPKRRRGRR